MQKAISIVVLFASTIAAMSSGGCSNTVVTEVAADPTQPANDAAAGSQDDTPSGASDSGKTDGAPEPPPPPSEKTGCQGTTYSEPLPTSASLEDLAYSAGTAQSYLLTALERRYPTGKYLLQGGLDSSLSASQGNCFDRFTRDKSTAARVLQQASTTVHECGHFFDLDDATGSNSAYHIRPDLSFRCGNGDTTARGGKTFARSLLNKDAYASKRPACAGSNSGCDSYADVYLTGDSTNGTFESGDQGYDSVLEEATQYVNSLASALAFEDSYGRGQRVSERDGILTFLWYMERYLKIAHESYPEAYAAISQDPCWRQATLTIWDRGWFYVNATATKTALGIDATAIEKLAQDSTLRAEIDALRSLECK